MQNITLIPLNFNKICRVCLSESENMTPIFSELFEQNVNQDTPFIYEVLLSISSIKVFISKFYTLFKIASNNFLILD